MLSPQTIQVNIQYILGHHFSRLTDLPLCDDYIRRRAQARKGKGGGGEGGEDRTKEGRWRGWGGEGQGKGGGGQGREEETEKRREHKERFIKRNVIGWIIQQRREMFE